MYNIYHLTTKNNDFVWTQDELKFKLESLANLKCKQSAWIREDLSLNRSSWFERLIWTVVAKHFSWLRRHLFGVDLKESRNLLKLLCPLIPKNKQIHDLYLKAVGKFNEIAPNHSFDPAIEQINTQLETPLFLQGYNTKEKLLSLLKKSGKQIRNLNLTGFMEIDNDDIEEIIGYCPHLEYLVLRTNHFDDHALFLISKKLPRLKDLDISKCEGFTDDGLSYLKNLKELKRVALGSCIQITDRGVAHLKMLTSLRELSLWECKKITDRGLAHLKKLISLQELDLEGCDQITDEGLRYLKRLINLKYLELGGCDKITDKGLGYLIWLRRLENLGLSSCKRVTDEGLEQLKRLLHLRELDLTECGIAERKLRQQKFLSLPINLNSFPNTKITYRGLEMLKKKLPRLRIIH